jgi:hypothetical protein
MNVQRSSVKHLLFLPYCKETRIISTVFRHTCEFQISWKPFQWEPSCSVRTDGQTGRNKPTATFRSFTKASKILQKLETDMTIILQTRRQASTKTSKLIFKSKIANKSIKYTCNWYSCVRRHKLTHWDCQSLSGVGMNTLTHCDTNVTIALTSKKSTFFTQCVLKQSNLIFLLFLQPAFSRRSSGHGSYSQPYTFLPVCLQ